MIKTKFCKQCKETKPATNEHFYKHPKTSDGFQPICITCHRNNMRRLKSTSGTWYKKKQWLVKWYEKNKKALSVRDQYTLDETG